jgi:hypothetical protein
MNFMLLPPRPAPPERVRAVGLRSWAVWGSIVRALVILAAVLAGTAACSSTNFDREHAVSDAINRSGGRLTRTQAECYVDRVVGELGSGTLDADPPPPERVSRLTQIRVDCVGVANLGTVAGTTPTVPPDPGVSDPRGPGDDPHLDALYARCQAGSGQACDSLFDEAPVGSVYEKFALTCGGRTSELRCADRYPG